MVNICLSNKIMSPSYLTISFSTDVPQEDVETHSSLCLPFASSDLCEASVMKAELLTQVDNVKDVYDLALTKQGIIYSYNPGDTIAILPANDENLVQKVIDRLDLRHVADKTCEIGLSTNAKKNAKIPKHLLQGSTIKKLLLYNLDINSAPKKLFLKSLIDYTSDEKEVLEIQNLCSAQGSNAYGEFITTKGRTLLGILEAFASCKPPFEILLEHLPSLKPRPYSISSSPLDDHLHITFFILVHEDGSKGVCTGWLEKLIKSNEIKQTSNENLTNHNRTAVPLYFRKPHGFTLPADDSIPIIMIATGTGVAPFRGFLRHRMLKSKSHSTKLGESWLFYGCRYSCRDFLYKDEITDYLRCGILNRLHLAFSRESIEKVYVQDRLMEYGKEVCELILEKNVTIFICGDAKTMIRDVNHSLKTILIRFGHLNEAKAADYLSEMQRQHRYVTDMWC